MFRTFRTVRTIGPGLRRLYHSVDHTASNVIIDSSSIQSKVLSKAMEYVPKYGFDSLCLTQAIRELGYADSLESAFTSSSGSSVDLQLVMFWLKSQRQKLHDHVMDPKSPFHSVSGEYDRISYLINKRLEFNKPILHNLSYGLGQLIIPYNAKQSLEELHNLSDDVAFYAGDTANDFAWYTKRFGVLSVYVSSELYMLNDTTENFTATSEFVENKVKELKTLGGAYNNVEQWSAFNAMSLVNLIKSQLARG